MERRYSKEITLLGKRIKQLRIERGLSQLDVEVHTGIDRGNLSKMERGKINMEFFTLVKLATVYNVKLSDLFTDK